MTTSIWIVKWIAFGQLHAPLNESL